MIKPKINARVEICGMGSEYDGLTATIIGHMNDDHRNGGHGVIILMDTMVDGQLGHVCQAKWLKEI